jgi:tRNA G18 (ribose-2'-O)-methylase SpoU
MNVGSLYRTAHAFGADFVFAIAPAVDMRMIRKSDTSETADRARSAARFG